MTKITDFLQTKLDTVKLQNALEVIEEFKSNESTEEWVMLDFSTWAKLEQLEEFLNHLVYGTELKEDTKEYITRQG